MDASCMSNLYHVLRFVIDSMLRLAKGLPWIPRSWGPTLLGLLPVFVHLLSPASTVNAFSALTTRDVLCGSEPDCPKNWKESVKKRSQGECTVCELRLRISMNSCILQEPLFVSDVEAGSGAQRIIPAPLSPPITDARMYNPIGEAVDDARRAAIWAIRTEAESRCCWFFHTLNTDSS